MAKFTQTVEVLKKLTTFNTTLKQLIMPVDLIHLVVWLLNLKKDFVKSFNLLNL